MRLEMRLEIKMRLEMRLEMRMPLGLPPSRLRPASPRYHGTGTPVPWYVHGRRGAGVVLPGHGWRGASPGGGGR